MVPEEEEDDLAAMGFGAASPPAAERNSPPPLSEATESLSARREALMAALSRVRSEEWLSASMRCSDPARSTRFSLPTVMCSRTSSVSAHSTMMVKMAADDARDRKPRSEKTQGVEL